MLVLTEDNKAMAKIIEIGVLSTNLFGYEEILKSVFSEWITCVVSDLCFFEIEVKNYEKLFESNLTIQRIEVIFDNDWPVEDSYNEGEIGE